MKVPLSWLKEFLPTKLSPEKIADTLTSLGLEVDAIHSNQSDFEGFFVAAVLSTTPHPNAENLCIAQVFDGTEELQVVCGASNCRKGLKTALAKIGTVLKDAEGTEFKIKKSKLRGIESFGMLCSHDELHVSKERYGVDDGIMEFPEEIPVGTPLKNLFSDCIFEISLTPNLNYCSSIFGVARELSAITQEKLHLPEIKLHASSPQKIDDLISVKIENFQDCPRYACRLVQNVKITESPDWIKQRLEKCGIRSINNIVDITNYVLLECGQPLHAFDYDIIDGHCVTIRKAKANEQLLMIDNKEHDLNESLLICDENSPIAIAGIMGGKNSQVSETTQNVLIESAYFSAGQIRRTSKRLGITTEASKRFERGTDPNGILRALDRAAQLMVEVAGGSLVSGTIDIANESFNSKIIACRIERLNAMLGTQLALTEVETIFHRLNFKTHIKASLIQVEVPTYRNDICLEIDLIEEVARIYGYDNIKKHSPSYRSSSIGHCPSFIFERKVRNALIGLGLQEFLTCDLISPAQAAWIESDAMPTRSQIKLINPSSIDQSVLRPSLLPGLLQVVKTNADHQIFDVFGFEVGRIHFNTKETFLEPSLASIVFSGNKTPLHWSTKEDELDFFDLKGLIENLFTTLCLKEPSFKSSHYQNFHPYRQASILVDNLEVGIMGEIHPSTLEKADVKQKVFFAELSIPDLFSIKMPEKRMKPLSEYPSSQRDFTITLKEDIAIGDILSAIGTNSSSLLEEFNLLYLYRNAEKLGAEWKNATFRFIYRDRKKTIAMEAVDKEHQRIIDLIHKKFGNFIKV